MPNHCTNNVEVKLRAGATGNALEVARKLTSFENIIPSPKEFEGIHSGGTRIEGIDTPAKAAPYYGWDAIKGIGGEVKGTTFISFRLWREEGGDKTKPGKAVPITLEEANAMLAKYGCIGWYDWCNAYWGTKWNAYDVSEPRGTEKLAVITFDTAWSPPTPVLEALAAMHPEMQITNRWREEGGEKGNDKIAPQSAEQLKASAKASLDSYIAMTNRIRSSFGG